MHVHTMVAVGLLCRFTLTIMYSISNFILDSILCLEIPPIWSDFEHLCPKPPQLKPTLFEAHDIPTLGDCAVAVAPVSLKR
jgi:hypothetical protein